MEWMIAAAIVGGLISVGSGIYSSVQEQKEIEKQKAEEKKLLESKKDLFNTQYEFTKAESLKNAHFIICKISTPC